jgi:[acyl-carrier-protein] S-malonyltransferase
MRLAILFSGQGGQRLEHWQQLAGHADGELRAALVERLPPLADPAFVPDADFLAANAVAQPLIVGQQLLLWSALRERLPRPICAAGYSLGELTACAAAGVLTPAAAVALAGIRARLMDAAATGGMLAVLGLDEALVSELAAAHGLAVAIRNAPRHVVLAGPADGLTPATEALAAAGASRLVPLAVRTPSHTPLLTSAAAAFRERLADLPDKRLSFPVLSAIDASPARTVSAAVEALAKQISTPLDWAACLEAIVELQPDAVLEIGPGNALAKLFGELAPAIPVRASDDFRSLDGIVRWLESCI